MTHIYNRHSRKTDMKDLGNKTITSRSVSRDGEETLERQEEKQYWLPTLAGANRKLIKTNSVEPMDIGLSPYCYFSTTKEKGGSTNIQ